MSTDSHHGALVLAGPRSPHNARARRQARDAAVSEVLAALRAISAPHASSSTVAAAVATLRREQERAGFPSHHHPIAPRESHRDSFLINARRPLPLTYAGQCDRRAITGEPRPGATPNPSDLAPLFTRRGHPVSEEEGERLSFLKPTSNSPKELALQRMEERHRYDRPRDPTGFSAKNEPPVMPDLHRTVPADFMPSCHKAETVASTGR